MANIVNLEVKKPEKKTNLSMRPNEIASCVLHYLKSHPLLQIKDKAAREGSLAVAAYYLKERYAQRECPDYPKSDWKVAVSKEETDLGYWEWVAVQFESDEIRASNSLQ